MKVKDLIKYLKKNLNPDDMCFSYDSLNGDFNKLCESQLITKKGGNQRVTAFFVSRNRIDF